MGAGDPRILSPAVFLPYGLLPWLKNGSKNKEISFVGISNISFTSANIYLSDLLASLFPFLIFPILSRNTLNCSILLYSNNPYLKKKTFQTQSLI